MTGIDHTVLSWMGEEAPEGFYGTSDYLWYYPDSPQNLAFVKDFMDKIGKYPSMFEWVGYMTAVTMKLGYEKAGKVDADEFVKALVGMKFDTPIGQVKIRTDHVFEAPIFIGTTYKSPKYQKFLIAKDIEAVPPEKIYPPEPKD
jgi:branched-chain amino acid transport system substrate-binding protein